MPDSLRRPSAAEIAVRRGSRRRRLRDRLGAVSVESASALRDGRYWIRGRGRPHAEAIESLEMGIQLHRDAGYGDPVHLHHEAWPLKA